MLDLFINESNDEFGMTSAQVEKILKALRVICTNGGFVLPEIVAAKIHPKRICSGCNDIIEGYMVINETWKNAELMPTDNVCLICLETKLQRPLTLLDFPCCHINLPLLFGFSLAKRTENA